VIINMHSGGKQVSNDHTRSKQQQRRVTAAAALDKSICCPSRSATVQRTRMCPLGMVLFLRGIIPSLFDASLLLSTTWLNSLTQANDNTQADATSRSNNATSRSNNATSRSKDATEHFQGFSRLHDHRI
jgi:hypothetical protein